MWATWTGPLTLASSNSFSLTQAQVNQRPSAMPHTICCMRCQWYGLSLCGQGLWWACIPCWSWLAAPPGMALSGVGSTGTGYHWCLQVLQCWAWVGESWRWTWCLKELGLWARRALCQLACNKYKWWLEHVEMELSVHITYMSHDLWHMWWRCGRLGLGDRALLWWLRWKRYPSAIGVVARWLYVQTGSVRGHTMGMRGWWWIWGLFVLLVRWDRSLEKGKKKTHLIVVVMVTETVCLT